MPFSVPLTEKPGDWIGRYRLLEELGQGGCGVVYMAEQEAPIRRKVALKVIKLGMDTKQVVARFEAERQALALMDHPNIAKVLDAGATGAGRPYFVMELVGGIRITDYCNQSDLTVRERLDLFIEVCRAIQHAHQKGVIHRDIKPSNVLVTTHDGAPVPKVIDFGIAKATQGRLTDQTLFTAFEQFLGTPAYMSPEQTQLGGLDIDTRSDIYSLGVLLYELLTDKTPFDTRDMLAAGLDEMRRTIREVEPLKPSTRLTQERAARLAVAGKSEIRNPKVEIDKDLDWIVMKCLEKDRARRYDSANGLVSDVQRHLNNELVEARPPSNLYRIRKLIRRNRVMVSTAATILAALLLGIVSSIRQAVRATRAEREQTRLRAEAQVEASKSREVAEFLKQMLAGVSPSIAAGRDTTVLKEMLDRTADRVSKELESQPLVVAELKEMVGDVYNSLTEFQKAEQLYRESLVIYRHAAGNNDGKLANCLRRIALATGAVGRYREAETLLREELALCRNMIPTNSHFLAMGLSDLANNLLTQGQYKEAESLEEEALTLKRRIYGEQSMNVAWSLRTLGSLHRKQGRLLEAERMLSESLAVTRQLGTLPNIAWALGDLGALFVDAGDFARAEATLKEQLEIERRVSEGPSASVRNTLLNLTRPLVRQGKVAEADSNLRDAVEIQNKRPKVELDDPTLNSWFGMELHRVGKLNEAEHWYRRSLSLESTSSKMPAHTYARMIHYLVALLAAQGRLSEIESAYVPWLQSVRTRLDPEHPGLALLLADLTRVMLAQEEFSLGEPMARECLAIREKKAPQGWQTCHAQSLLGRCLLGQRKYAEAEPLLVSGYTGMRDRQSAIPDQSKPLVGEALQSLIQLYEALEQPDRGAAWENEPGGSGKAPTATEWIAQVPSESPP